MTERFRDIDVVQAHIHRAADWLSKGEYADFVEGVENTIDAGGRWGPQLESPLEALFWVWWQAVSRHGSLGYKFHLETQHVVQVSGVTFRLDFVVKLVGWDLNHEVESGRLRWPLFGVELDGHSFHEKTREQVAYRNQRDRLLHEAGWTIFHFSWSEITERPEECVTEVLLAARDRYNAMLMESVRRKAADGAAANQVGATTPQES